MAKSFTATELGTSRIVKALTTTETGISRIKTTATKTELGNSRVQKTLTKTETGASNIASSGSSRTTTETGISRIVKSLTTTETGLSRIKVTTVSYAGEVLHYKLDENPASNGSVIADSSINALNGTLVTDNGAANKSVTGKLGQAISLDGVGDLVSIPATGDYNVRGNLGFQSADAFTVSIWYKGTDTTSFATVSKALVGWNSDNLYAQLGMNGGIPEWTHYNAGWLHESATTNIADNNWHNVTLVNSGNLGNLYVDGRLENSGLSSTISSSNYFQPFSIGASDGTPSPTQYTTGAFDELRIFNRALSASEVINLSNIAPEGPSIFGIARIQKTIATTESGISRIKNTVTKTETGVSRIDEAFTKTETGISRIQKTFTATETGISRIKNTAVIATELGVSRIKNTVTKTETGVSRIDEAFTRTQTGISRVTKALTASETGISRIRNSVTKTETGISRLVKSLTATETGVSNITQTNQTKTTTEAGISRIKNQETTTITGRSRLKNFIDYNPKIIYVEGEPFLQLSRQQYLKL